MNELSNETALALLRTLPGDARVLPTTMAGTIEFMVQFESGIEIFWNAIHGTFDLQVNEKARDSWAEWKANAHER